MEEQPQLLLLLSSLLCLFAVQALFPVVRPDSPHMLIEDFFTVTCGENGSLLSPTSHGSALAGWRVMRNTTGGIQSTCGVKWGRISDSSCLVSLALPSDSGVYWCESSDGATSDTVNITVSRFVVLQSPIHPVMEGDTATLRCRAALNGLMVPMSFFKNGSCIGTEEDGEFQIYNVSKSDEGMYWCSVQGRESAPRWLTVEVAPPTQTPTQTPPSSPVPSSTPSTPQPTVLRLLCHLVVICPFILSTVLMGMLCQKSLKDAAGELTKVAESPGLEEDRQVTTEHRF
ncbi:low affinity immunoglobulin gamma Fc region receptor III-like isoform 2-T2 [Synchiropus picturatus]